MTTFAEMIKDYQYPGHIINNVFVGLFATIHYVSTATADLK